MLEHTSRKGKIQSSSACEPVNAESVKDTEKISRHISCVLAFVSSMCRWVEVNFKRHFFFFFQL